MKERPITFTGKSVLAIQKGSKTQTRRLVRPQPDTAHENCPYWKVGGYRAWPYYKGVVDVNRMGSNIPLRCPYGNVGERMWVRETWADVNSEMGPTLLYRSDSHMVGWEDFCTEFGPNYGAGPSMDYEKYPGDYVMWWSDLLSGAPDHHWKSPLRMPRWASRQMLTVTGVRVERLQDISEEDAKAEGGPPSHGSIDVISREYGFPDFSRSWFAQTWDHINGKRASWDSNPWVWVIEFHKVVKYEH